MDDELCDYVSTVLSVFAAARPHIQSMAQVLSGLTILVRTPTEEDG